MERREFLTGLSVAGAGLALSACASSDCDSPATGKLVTADKPIEWKMATTWPKNFPGLGTGANLLADLVERMSGGRLKIKVYGAGELGPALQVFDLVSAGTAEIGHGAAYYWKGKAETAQFFTVVPFGMNGPEMLSWLEYGGGNELWRELYEPFNVVPFAAGNTGVQMGGWFNKDINSVADLEGLKMRIPGLGGEVLKRAGGTPVNLPGGELFTALQSGVIDATEWVGPYNDLAFGLHKAAKKYYYPGWHEAGSVLEALVNKEAWEALPADLQAIVETACQAMTQSMLAEYAARNNKALQTLTQEHGVEVKRFPDDVLKRLHELSDEVVREVGQRDDFAKRVYASFTAFHDQVVAWNEVSDAAYYRARKL